MSTTDNTLVTTTAVYLGAVLLVGLPVTAVLSTVLGELAATIGWELAGTWASVGILVISLLVGLQAAVEVAAIQLGGIEALNRGSPRVALIRQLAITASVFATLAAIVWFVLSIVSDQNTVVVALSVLVAGAAIVVLLRGVGAFFDGVRSV